MCFLTRKTNSFMAFPKLILGVKPFSASRNHQNRGLTLKMCLKNQICGASRNSKSKQKIVI